jgi:uncharacterized protein YdaU (DUF1376 family)
LNYVERHFGDWARDTAHLSMLEDGAYNRLVDLYYVRESPLPRELGACCRLVRAVSKSEREAVKSVLAEFFDDTPDGWMHKRCDAEIERFRNKSGKARASANARWGADRSHSDGNADAYANASPNAMPTHSEGNATRGRGQARSHSPVASNQKPVTKEPGESARSRALLRPDGVSEQVWDDWLALRKAKKAPVTATTLDEATSEAGKAGMTLNAFLREWCVRGSQGLKADWLRPNGSSPPRPAPQTTAERNAEAKRLLGFETKEPHDA